MTFPRIVIRTVEELRSLPDGDYLIADKYGVVQMASKTPDLSGVLILDFGDEMGGHEACVSYPIVVIWKQAIDDTGTWLDAWKPEENECPTSPAS